MHLIRNLLVLLLILPGCGDQEKKKQSGSVVYDRSDGLFRFINDNRLQLLVGTGDPYHLIIVNNRSCNCGTPGFQKIDSALSTLNDLPALWVLSDPDSLIESEILLRGNRFVYPDSTNYSRYGLATIDPQIFTIDKNHVTGFVGIKHN